MRCPIAVKKKKKSCNYEKNETKMDVSIMIIKPTCYN